MSDEQYLEMIEKARSEFASLLKGHPPIEVSTERYEEMLDMGVANLPLNLQEMVLDMETRFKEENAYALSYPQISLAFFCAANGLQLIRIMR